MKKFLSIILLSTLLFTSCVTTSQDVNVYINGYQVTGYEKKVEQDIIGWTVFVTLTGFLYVGIPIIVFDNIKSN